MSSAPYRPDVWKLALLLLVGLALPTLLGIWRQAHAAPVGCPTGPADTLLVMGAAQYDGVPSPVLARRLDKALELFKAGCAEKIVVTGGKRPGDRFTEGEAGVRYLAARGVPGELLFSETESRSSLENLSFSRPLVAGERLLIVTDDLHAYRTGFLARELGFDAQVAGVQTNGPRLGYMLREAAGVTAYLLGYR